MRLREPAAGRTRIKICGITRREDALLAVELGADAIGLVFYPHSPRVIDTGTARDIVAALPPYVTVVGLFVDQDGERIRSILEQVPIDLLQFHGAESPAACGLYSRPYVKAVRMRQGVDLQAIARNYTDARALLLDTHVAGQAGGSGQSFNWDLVPRNLGKPVVLAGGLDPENVVSAIQRVRPYAVDVSSGVEATPGIKDPDRMAAFIEQVIRA